MRHKYSPDNWGFFFNLYHFIYRTKLKELPAVFCHYVHNVFYILVCDWWHPLILLVQARGKKRQIGWFPANYVKLLSPSTSKTTPTEPTPPKLAPASTGTSTHKEHRKIHTLYHNTYRGPSVHCETCWRRRGAPFLKRLCILSTGQQGAAPVAVKGIQLVYKSMGPQTSVSCSVHGICA